MRQKKNQKGFSLIELLIVVAIIGILAAIAVPNMIASRKAANEASAVSSIRTISTAQQTYRMTYGGGATYASTLDDLHNNGLIIDAVLSTGHKSSYDLTMTSSGSSFSVQADPASTGAGDRHFFTDETGVIRFSKTGAAGTGDPPI